MARKGIRYSQQDPSPRKGVRKDCEECQKLYGQVRYDRSMRRANWIKPTDLLRYTERSIAIRHEAEDVAALKAHVATHSV